MVEARCELFGDQGTMGHGFFKGWTGEGAGWVGRWVHRTSSFPPPGATPKDFVGPLPEVRFVYLWLFSDAKMDKWVSWSEETPPNLTSILFFICLSYLFMADANFASPTPGGAHFREKKPGEALKGNLLVFFGGDLKMMFGGGASLHFFCGFAFFWPV